MPWHPHLPHLLYSLTITSLAVHLVVHRRHAEQQRSQLSAQISILSSVADKLSSASSPVDKEEIVRMRRLAGRAGELAWEGMSIGNLAKRDLEGGGEELSWKDVVLGRKDVDGGHTVDEELAALLREIAREAAAESSS